MAYRLHLELKQLPESLNRALRTHAHSRNAKGKAWDCLIAVETSRHRPPEPLRRARITLVRHSHRMLDFDGVVGSLKPVVDALIAAKILADDSWNVLGRWEVDQRFRPKKDGPLLEIQVEEAES